MVSFLDMRRDPQAVMSGVGMLVLLTAVAFAVLDDVYVAGVELQRVKPPLDPVVLERCQELFLI